MIYPKKGGMNELHKLDPVICFTDSFFLMFSGWFLVLIRNSKGLESTSDVFAKRTQRVSYFHTKLSCCPRSVGESLMTAWLLTSVETQIKAHVHTKIQISMSQGIFYDWVKALVSLCRSCHLCLWACACEREKDRCLISALHCSGRQSHSCSVTAPEAVVWSEIHQAERTQPSVDSASQPAMSHHFGFFIFQACEDRGRVWRRGELKSSTHLGEKGELDGRLRPLYLSLCSLKCFSCVILLVQI